MVGQLASLASKVIEGTHPCHEWATASDLIDSHEGRGNALI